MNILPVIDLKGGRAVQAVTGQRSEYRPIRSVLCAGARPAALAEAYVRHLAAGEIYVADIDAIAGLPLNKRALAEIAGCGARPWVDAGLHSPATMAALVEACSAFEKPPVYIVALETLPGWKALGEIVAAAQAAGHELAFSLDMRTGRPQVRAQELALAPLEIARRAAEAGFGRLIVLDLAGVGSSAGPTTLELCRAVQSELPQVQLVTGGGVRDLADLQALSEAGCWGALVGTALHRGELNAAMISGFRAKAS